MIMKSVLWMVVNILVLALWIGYVFPDSKEALKEGWVPRWGYVALRVIGYPIVGFEVVSFFLYLGVIIGLWGKGL